MELVEMNTDEQALMRDFAQTIRFNMGPFRAGDLIISYDKLWVSNLSYVYRLQIRLKGGDLVLTHQISEDQLFQAFHPDELARFLAAEFSKKFREYYQKPEDNVILGEN